MRLINSKTLALTTFLPHDIPDYVILSHRWGPEEVTYKEICQIPLSEENSPARRLAGFDKVRGTCELALGDGYQWVWIDSCCIDKDSSADVDKNINSMWTYYAEANICYVYLADVPDAAAGWSTSFQTSDWFDRGWTLQELVAPVYVEFYAADWSAIGTKLERVEEIAEMTTIDLDVMAQTKSIDDYTASEILSWVAHRQVTQEEDESYSLLGLFQIHMPMLYGEGRAKAFARLLEAVYLAKCDDSIFLFRYSIHIGDQPLIADCTDRFCQRPDCELPPGHVDMAEMFAPQIHYPTITPSDFWESQPHEQMMSTVTRYETRVSVPLIIAEYDRVVHRLIFFGHGNSKQRPRPSHVAILNHTTEDYVNGAFCLLLWRRKNSEDSCFCRLPKFPALLPDLNEFRPMLRKTKVLLLGPMIKYVFKDVQCIFKILEGPFKVLLWDANLTHSCGSVSSEQISGENSDESLFRIKLINTDLSRKTEVSCTLNCPQGMHGDCQILVKIEEIDEIHDWYIKEVSEANTDGRGRFRKHRSIFRSTTPCDRCKVQLQNGDQVVIGIRRLACEKPSKGDSCVARKRYQIIFRHCQDSDSSVHSTRSELQARHAPRVSVMEMSGLGKPSEGDSDTDNQRKR